MNLQFSARSSATWFFALSASIVCLASTAVGSATEPQLPDCLNSQSTQTLFNPGDHEGCIADQANFGQEGTILKAEQFLSISPSEVRFIGCNDAPFRTYPPSANGKTLFKVYYPTGITLSHNGYLAPLLHELGHVYQLKQAGSYAKLEASPNGSIERVELGADFLAGIVGSRLGLEPKSFLVNLSLVGSYRGGDTLSHGRPEDRAAAFRYGYFYQESQASINSSYSDFQDNLFAQIKHS
jgi:hypothetical protein